MTAPLESASISGTAQVGATMTASAEPAGATAAYQWQSAAEQEGSYADIADATDNAYLLTEAEAGKYIKVRATGTGRYTGEVLSAAAGPVAPAAKAAVRAKKKG